jgi:hypothetical protein
MVGHEACSSSWSFTMVRILWRFFVFCRHPTPSAPCMHAASGWSSLRKTGCQPIVAHVVHAIIPSDTFVSDPAPYMVVEFAYQPTDSHDHCNGAQRQQFVTTTAVRAAVKLGWLRRRSVASACQYKPTVCRARAGVSIRAPHTSPVISRKIHGDMALSRTLLARAGVLSCEPPKSVGRLGWSTAWLGCWA